MDKQTIKEMAKEIAKTLFDDCLLNNGGHCEDCECNREETKEYDCQSYLVAKKILEKYQPKIPENAVVLTRGQYEEVLKLLKEYNEIQNNFPNQVNAMIENYNKGYEKGSKEMAEKFAERLKEEVLNFCGTVEENGYFETGKRCFCEDIDEICKEITEDK